MKIIYRMSIALLAGVIFGGLAGLKIGYNLPREHTTEVNWTVEKMEAKKGGTIDFDSSVEITPDSAHVTKTRKELRQERRGSENSQ